MENYFIYHIPGVKIGCSMNPSKRVKDQGYEDFEILEVHTDIEVASDREIKLMKEYGYTRDSSQRYSDTVKMGKKGANSYNIDVMKRIAKKGANTTNSLRVTCPLCGHVTHPGGLGNHKKKCYRLNGQSV